MFSKRLYQLLSSIKLTIILTYLIILNAVIGSLIILYASERYARIDKTLLFNWLTESRLAESWWIVSLITLIFFFSLNTLCCTYDRLSALLKARKGRRFSVHIEEETLLTEDIDRRKGVRLRTFLPYFAHLGFLVAVAGHLTGSLWGFRGEDIFAVSGDVVQIKENKQMSLEIEDLIIQYSEKGYLNELKGKVALLSHGKRLKESMIEINRPLLYGNMAVYIKSVQTVPQGLILRKTGGGKTDRFLLKRGSRIPLDGKDLMIAGGRIDQRSGAMEVLGFKGEHLLVSKWLSPFNKEMRSVEVDGYRIVADKFSLIDVGTFNVNKDPGALIVFSGLAIFMAALVGHLVLRQMK